MSTATGVLLEQLDALRVARARVQELVVEAGFAQRQTYQLWRLCTEARQGVVAGGPDWHRAVRVADRAYDEYAFAHGRGAGLTDARHAIAELITTALDNVELSPGGRSAGGAT